MSGIKKLGVFPLGAVLFPSGSLPLRIFEPRYIDLLSSCLRNQESFVIAPLLAGSEVGNVQTFSEFGTTASIAEWDKSPDGLLHIVVTGGQRCRLKDHERQTDGLLLASVELVVDSPSSMPNDYQHLADSLEFIFRSHPELAPAKPWHLTDANWVSYRWAERLPLTSQSREQVLSADTGEEKLELINKNWTALTRDSGGATRH